MFDNPFFVAKAYSSHFSAFLVVPPAGLFLLRSAKTETIRRAAAAALSLVSALLFGCGVPLAQLVSSQDVKLGFRVIQ